MITPLDREVAAVTAAFAAGVLAAGWAVVVLVRRFRYVEERTGG